MGIFINDLSFQEQGVDINEARNLVVALARTLKNLAPVNVDGVIGVCEDFFDKRPAPDQTISLLIRNWRDPRVQVEAQRIRELMNNRPTIQEMLEDNFVEHECRYKEEPYPKSCFAAAAIFGGVLAGISRSPDFSLDSFDLNYRVDEEPVFSNTTVDNFFCPVRANHYVIDHMNDGNMLWANQNRLFENLQFLNRVENQVRGLPIHMMSNIKNHLKTINDYCRRYSEGGITRPDWSNMGINASNESESTSGGHRMTFYIPQKKDSKQFVWHSKPADYRIYFYPPDDRKDKCYIGFIDTKDNVSRELNKRG